MSHAAFSGLIESPESLHNASTFVSLRVHLFEFMKVDPASILEAGREKLC
jgi:hypothetical protein